MSLITNTITEQLEVQELTSAGTQRIISMEAIVAMPVMAPGVLHSRDPSRYVDGSLISEQLITLMNNYRIFIVVRFVIL